MTRSVRPLGRLLAASIAVLLGVLSFAGGAAAQESDESDELDTLVVRSVDGRDPDAVEVRFLYSGPRQTVPDLVVRENGRIVPSTSPVLIDEAEDFGIVLAIDTSSSMTENAGFERAKDAALAFVENKEPDDQVAIVSFNDTVQIVQRFTDDPEVLGEAIDRLGLSGSTALYDAVRESVNLFEGTDLVPNVVLITDGRDSVSTSSVEIAEGLLADTNTLLFAIGIESDDLDVGTLERLTGRTGGAVLRSADPSELAGLLGDVQSRLRRQFVATFVSETEQTGPADLTLTIGTASTDGSYTPGARLDSTVQVEPVEVPGRRGISALQSPVFLWLAVLLVLVAVGAAVYAVAVTVLRERQPLDAVMQPYNDGFVAPADDSDRLATSAILQRAVEMTGSFAERRGFLARTEDMLERADQPLRAAEALFFWLVASVTLIVLGGLIAGSFAAALLIAVLAVVVPPGVIVYLASRRQKRFNEQLPDMLALLASTLRAGYSLMQGVEAAAQEVTEPIRKELQRVVTEARLGMTLEQAFEGVAVRMGSRDFEWVTMAIGIQREVGGNLAEILDTVGETMTARDRLRRDISALTAEGRISALVLGILPIAVGVMIFTISPDYMQALFDQTAGLVMLGISVVLMGFGFWWMFKIIDIEV